MPTLALTANVRPLFTSLRGRLLNTLATPADVFEEVAAAPPTVSNWLVPTLLVCLTGTILLQVAATEEQTASAVGQLVAAGTVSAAQAEKLSRGWQMISPLATCLGAFAGMFWSAFVLWLIGRVFLKARFSFLKTIEVVGLSEIILVLGAVVTVLLIAACGDAAARPALSLFAGKLDSSGPIRSILETMNFFHLWTTTVLAVGLSKLSGVSFKESAFWVFGYWVLVRIALILKRMSISTNSSLPMLVRLVCGTKTVIWRAGLRFIIPAMRQ